MRSVLDPEGRDALLARLRTLEEGRPARWGGMDVHQMVCHVGDPVRVALGEIPAADISTGFTRTLMKRLVLWGAPPPKGRIRTFPEIDQVAGGGTRPRSLDADVHAFEELLERFARHVEAGEALSPSPVFGALTGRQWGRLLWTHTHHHLRQFGA